MENTPMDDNAMENMPMEDNPLSPYDLEISVEGRKKMIAHSIRAQRAKKGYKQREVADILKVSQQVYSGYENGRNEPPAEILVRLSFLYGVSLDDLMEKMNFFPSEQKALKAIHEFRKEMADIKTWFPQAEHTDNAVLQRLLRAMESLSEVDFEAEIEKIRAKTKPEKSEPAPEGS